MDNYFNHQELIKKNKLLLTKQMPKSLRLFDRPIGLFFKKRTTGGCIDYTPIKIGKNGQCDLWGVVSCYIWINGQEKSIIPVHVEIEVKTGKGELNPDQIIWRDFCLTMGWVHIVAREETDVAREILMRVNKMGLYLCQ